MCFTYIVPIQFFTDLEIKKGKKKKEKDNESAETSIGYKFPAQSVLVVIS